MSESGSPIDYDLYQDFFDSIDNVNKQQRALENRLARFICRQFGLSTAQIESLISESNNQFCPEWLSERFNLPFIFALAETKKLKKFNFEFFDYQNFYEFLTNNSLYKRVINFFFDQRMDLQERYPGVQIFVLVFPATMNSKLHYLCAHNYSYAELLNQLDYSSQSLKWCLSCFNSEGEVIHFQLLSSFINLIKSSISLGSL